MLVISRYFDGTNVIKIEITCVSLEKNSICRSVNTQTGIHYAL